jgi:sodium-dependent dicarboxylate transporter 2/3/5
MGVHDRGAPYATGLLLMVTWGSSVAVGTIVGTPPNLIAISHLQHTVGMRIGFLEWMAFGIPITFTMLGVCWLVLRLLYGRSAPATSRIAPHAAQVFQRMGPLGAGERNALVAFLTAVTLWVLPGVAELLVGSEHPIAAVLTARLDPAVAALTGAILLFALPSRGDRSGVLTWKEAAAIDWGTILLFGGGIALGRAIFDSGLAESLGRALARASGAGTVWGITALVTAVAIAFSELASNTASAATTVPLAIGLAVGAGVSPIGPALGAGLGASFGFMLPISTPPNAIVYSSGLIPPGQMMRTGFIIDLAGFAVTMLWLFLILPAIGLL